MGIRRHSLWGMGALAASTLLGFVFSAASADTAVKPYLVAVGGQYEVTPLFSVGDTVPHTDISSLRYQMIGIPDGLGARARRGGNVTLYISHEIPTEKQSEPVIGSPLNRGAIVSKFILDESGDVVSGRRAYDTVFNQNHLVGPAAQVDNDTPAFGRFCSGSLAGADEGFDRPIYFANEEASGTNRNGVTTSFDGRGGLSVAIFDNEAHTLPKLGRFSKENSLVMRGTGPRTVIFSLEDGGADSQLYMYVGTKERHKGAGALARNGLDNGELFVFASTTPGMNNERDFQTGRITGKWARIRNADNMGEMQLESASDQAGAFSFVRIEDGAFSKTRSHDFFFDTTGGNPTEGNELGRLYALKLNKDGVRKPAKLRVVYNADRIIAGSEDIAVSPDNVDTSGRYLMVDEGGTGRATPVLEAKERDFSVWRFRLTDRRWSRRVSLSSARRVAQVNPPGRDGVVVPPGSWESSGVISTAGLFGKGTWLQDVQAHPPSTAPPTNTVEDGQLLLMRSVR